MEKVSIVEERRAWSQERLLNLIIKAHYDLFSIKGFEPEPEDITNWLNEYLKKETFG